MVAANDLTTLANVKPFCSNAANADAVLGRLITQASRFIYGYLNLPTLLPTPVTEVLDGGGSDRWANIDEEAGRRIGFTRRPILSLTSLTIDGVAIDQAADPAPGTFPQGWVLDAWDGTVPGNAQFLTLRGCQRFTRGRRNVVVSYVAGYQISAEAATVPNASPYQVAPAQPAGRIASDVGVVYASGGTPLVPIATGTPAQGQYLLDLTAGAYTFASADAGAGVLLTYGFIPADLEQVCIEIVAERYSYKDRIGVMSKSLATQETVSYSPRTMSAYVQSILDNYRDPVFA